MNNQSDELDRIIHGDSLYPEWQKSQLIDWHQNQVAAVLRWLLDKKGTYISIDDNGPIDCTPIGYIQAKLKEYES